MNGNSIFLDTNILIYLLKGNKEIADLLNRKEFIISFITELELLSFPFEDKNEYNQIKKLLSECTII
ncbi:MAG: PIN domain-containing protein, partial [Opitutaceae bacterium]|nr:PIN domain-containing protein [Cytophagales bacterium]